MHEIERNRSQKLGCQANGGACAGHAPLDPPMITVKRFYKGGKAYSSEGDVCEKEIEKQDGSLSDGDRHKTDVSPDKCVVTFSKNAVKIKDTVTPR